MASWEGETMRIYGIMRGRAMRMYGTMEEGHEGVCHHEEGHEFIWHHEREGTETV